MLLKNDRTFLISEEDIKDLIKDKLKIEIREILLVSSFSPTKGFWEVTIRASVNET